MPRTAGEADRARRTTLSQEAWEDSPEDYPQTPTHPEWWRLPDEYGDSTGSRA